jgi:hypothetical protein
MSLVGPLLTPIMEHTETIDITCIFNYNRIFNNKIGGRMGESKLEQPICRLITNVGMVALEDPSRRMVLRCHGLTLRRYWDAFAEAFASNIQGSFSTEAGEVFITFILPIQCGPLEYEIQNAVTLNGEAVPVIDQRPQAGCKDMRLVFKDGTRLQIITSNDREALDVQDFDIYDKAQEQLHSSTARYRQHLHRPRHSPPNNQVS